MRDRHTRGGGGCPHLPLLYREKDGAAGDSGAGRSDGWPILVREEKKPGDLISITVAGGGTTFSAHAPH